MKVKLSVCLALRHSHAVLRVEKHPPIAGITGSQCQNQNSCAYSALGVHANRQRYLQGEALMFTLQIRAPQQPFVLS